MEIKAIFFLTVLIAGEQTCNQPLHPEISKTTSQMWIGGIAGSGYGTYYRIYLPTKNAANYVFDSLWVNEKRIAVISAANSTGDTLVLTANDHISGVAEQQSSDHLTDTIKIAFPVKIDAAGLLGSFYKGKRMYYPVKEWTVLKPLYYQ